MDSLTTAYLVCILIGSVGSVVGAYVGNRMAPIESSAVPIVSTPLEQLPEKPEPVPAEPPQSTEQTVPPEVPSAV